MVRGFAVCVQRRFAILGCARLQARRCAVELRPGCLALPSAARSLQWRMRTSPASSSPWPNRSFERTANGEVHLRSFASAVPPSSAAQLQR
mgnify:CR=1 FL=1